MPKQTQYIVQGYAQVWPRAVFDIRQAGKLDKDIKRALGSAGVYVLYREDTPYYIGKTGGTLFDRIWNHANQPGDRYYCFWDYFSAFAVEGEKHRGEVEGILIAAMPTANSASPRFPRIKLPARVATLLKERREIVIRQVNSERPKS